MCEHGQTELVKILKPREFSKRTMIPVDKCMAPLITELNKFGFETLGCCCGHGNPGYLQIKLGTKIKRISIDDDKFINIEFWGKT